MLKLYDFGVKSSLYQKRTFLEQTPHLCLSRGVRFVHDQEGSIGIARFKASSLPETEMVAACGDCARLSIADDHSSITSSSTAVLTTRLRASTSWANLFCCSKAVSKSTCLAQLKEPHTVCPCAPSSSSSRLSSSSRPRPRGSCSALIRKRPSCSRRPTSRPLRSNSARTSSSECSSPP